MLITLQQLRSALQAVKSYITSVVPTKTSDLTNDSGFINDVYVDNATASLPNKNLLHNTKPLQTGLVFGSDQIEILGWMFARANNAMQAEFYAGENMHFNVPSANVSAGASLYQMVKIYKNNGSIIENGGGEIAELINDKNAVLSFSIKTNKKIDILTVLSCKFKDGTSALNSFIAENTINPDNDFTQIVIKDTIPENWQEVITSENAKTVRLLFQVKTASDVVIDSNDLDFYIRNVQMEYGTEATDYKYSDWDIEYALSNNISEILNKVNTTDLSSVATSGDYDDLLNKPSIPSKTSDLTNDSGFIGSASVTSIWTGTQAQYEALTPDTNTLYFIQEV